MEKDKETILTIARTQTLSLVETISAGYRLLNRRLWVLVIPIALDLYLWLGTSLSFAPFLRLYRDWIAAGAGMVTSGLREQEQLIVWILNTDIRSVLAWISFVPLFVPQLALSGSLIPSRVVYLQSPAGVVFSSIVGSLTMLMVSSVFLSLLACGLREECATLKTYIRHLLTSILGIGGYLLIMLGAGATVSLLCVPLLVGAVLFVPVLVLPVLLLWFTIGFWAYIYTGFAIEGVLLKGVNPLRAILLSITLVRRFFPGTLALLALSALIMVGLNVLWQSLVGNLPGLLLAMVGNAYIGSGLIAARMVFYQDRLASAVQETATSEKRKG